MNTEGVAVRRSRAVTVAVWLACVVVVALICRPFYLMNAQRALKSAVSRGTARDVERLLWLGAEANGRSITLSVPDAIWYPLDDAVQRDDPEIVRVLLAHGVRIKQPGADSNLLLVAARGGHVATIRLLLDHGADIRDMDPNNNSALMAGAAYPNVVETLIEYGAPINTANKLGETPLILASQSLNVDGVRVLLNHGANLDTQDVRGNTPLMVAVLMCPSIDTPQRVPSSQLSTQAEPRKISAEAQMRLDKVLVIVKLLLEHGADPNVRALYNVSPLREADHRSAELAKLLREHGAKK